MVLSTVIYFVQFVAILMNFNWKMDVNKKFIRYAIYISIPSFVCSLVTVLLTRLVNTIGPTLAIAWVGSGILISDWVMKKLTD